MVEAIVAMSLLAVALVGSTVAINAIRKSERSTQEKMAVTLSIAEARGFASRVVSGVWRRMAERDCKNPDAVITLLRGLLSPEEFTLLDKNELEALTTGGLRDEISQVMSKKGDEAFRSCSSADVLSNPQLERLSTSTFNQALCRCATAKTAYETFRSKVEDHSDREAIYACLMTTSESKQRMVIEITAYAVDLGNANRLTCRDLASIEEDGMLKRVDYSVNLDGLTASQVSGTFYLPLGGRR